VSSDKITFGITPSAAMGISHLAVSSSLSRAVIILRGVV
jgi:hypothetical protein